MRACRAIPVMALCLCALAPASADRDEMREQLLELKKTLSGLDWKSVDFSDVSVLERCRTLILLNESLDELGSTAVTEADLLGQFLEKQNLYDKYAADPPAATMVASDYDDACKIANAMLRGPMSDSRYATDLSDVDERGLQAYEKAYTKTCREKWGQFAAASHDARSMAAFLNAQNKIKDYMAWAEAETTRLQQQHNDEMAQRRAAVAAQEQQEHAEHVKAEQQHEQEHQQQVQSQLAQQAMYAAQQQEADAPVNTGTVVESGGYYGSDWYPGWYYGVAANVRRPGAFYRAPAHRTAATERVTARRGAVRRP